MKNRLLGLDAIRIFLTLMIFLFHANMHLGCTFSIATIAISQGAIFMTAFFMLSGFVIFYTNEKKELYSIKEIKLFYLARLSHIYPLYFFTYFLFLLFLNSQTIIENIVIAPFELLLLQTEFCSVFNVLHNGGTWFISCIFLCYLLYPFFQIL